ncbi:hypothetical protein QQS21_001924 [Conoideocrella luteorostrata]|uniref:Myb-like domain-containing protein n=1 Tax=Conoideocrella luteorostrata TaxID=1105319 RepID=A0AAJ0G1K2_9HYPO|nr:hypothetical protein QQS21_001924 [Conoideocrella luteorostrata]
MDATKLNPPPPNMRKTLLPSQEKQKQTRWTTEENSILEEILALEKRVQLRELSAQDARRLISDRRNILLKGRTNDGVSSRLWGIKKQRDRNPNEPQHASRGHFLVHKQFPASQKKESPENQKKHKLDIGDSYQSKDLSSTIQAQPSRTSRRLSSVETTSTSKPDTSKNGERWTKADIELLNQLNKAQELSPDQIADRLCRSSSSIQQESRIISEMKGCFKNLAKDQLLIKHIGNVSVLEDKFEGIACHRLFNRFLFLCGEESIYFNSEDLPSRAICNTAKKARKNLPEDYFQRRRLWSPEDARIVFDALQKNVSNEEIQRMLNRKPSQTVRRYIGTIRAVLRNIDKKADKELKGLVENDISWKEITQKFPGHRKKYLRLRYQYFLMLSGKELRRKDKRSK